jgi:outer membrane protein OmpA-like peptidoglycan-associated protein
MMLSLGHSSFLYGQEYDASVGLNALISKNYRLGSTLLDPFVDNLGAHIHRDTVYFSTNEKIRNVKQYVNKDNSYFYNLYKAPLNDVNKNQQLLVKGSIRSELNESLPVITKNGNTMYYTGNYIKNDRIHKNLNILKATKKNGIWGNIEYISLNSEAHSNGQAVLNDSETKMYFVSDRDSISGNTDIYEVAVTKTGVFSIPKKLGDLINTSANEIAPYITKNNELYFSSDRQGGFGGFDIFYIDLNNKELAPINLGSTINSVADDFAFSIHMANSKGFLTSNRSGSKLNLYTVEEKEPIQKIIKDYQKKEEQFKLDKKYQITLQENKIIAPNNLGFLPGENGLNKEGKEFLDYLISYIRKNPAAVIDVNSFIKTGTLSNDLVNERIAHVIDEINKTTKYAYNFKIKSKKLEPTKRNTAAGIAFYFDYNSSYLSALNKEQLMDIAKTLKGDASAMVVFSTHTDSRGSDAYNTWLSQRRLEAIQNFYTKKGISKDQISGKAYGETLLINKCTNGVNCTEEEHVINRRVGYEIIPQKTFVKLKE